MAKVDTDLADIGNIAPLSPDDDCTLSLLLQFRHTLNLSDADENSSMNTRTSPWPRTVVRRTNNLSGVSGSPIPREDLVSTAVGTARRAHSTPKDIFAYGTVAGNLFHTDRLPQFASIFSRQNPRQGSKTCTQNSWADIRCM